MSRINRIGILAVRFNIGLITVIFGLLPRAHLSPKEHRNSDEERTTDDQRRRQRRQIREHAGHLLEFGVRSDDPPLGIVTHQGRGSALGPAH